MWFALRQVGGRTEVVNARGIVQECFQQHPPGACIERSTEAVVETETRKPGNDVDRCRQMFIEENRLLQGQGKCGVPKTWEKIPIRPIRYTRGICCT